GEFRWGIVSGFRRIAVFRELHAWEMPGYDTIPAFVRERATVPDTFAAMVEENETRADLSPWEKGRIATQAWRFHVFPTIDAAVDHLYPAADKVKRARLRAIAHLAESFDGLLKQPEKLSQRQAMRM